MAPVVAPPHRIRLGFAVKVLSGGGLPSHDARRWQSEPHLRVSLGYLRAIARRLDELDIRMYRMATNLAPYASHPDLPGFRHQVEGCRDELEELGALFVERDIRLSTHPGQYTVLNSVDADVVAASVAELEVQASLLDAMGLPEEAVVVVHAGGGRGGRDEAFARFEDGFRRLSDAAQRRVALENDDRTFDLVDAVELARRIGRPVVFDVLHHHCLDRHGLTDIEALDLALMTWPGWVMPKIHYSSPRLDVVETKRRAGRRVELVRRLPELRAHADLIDPLAFEAFMGAAGDRRFDVMLEAKAKDLALLRLRDHLRGRGFDL